MMRLTKILIVFSLLAGALSPVSAAVYPLGPLGDDLVGEVSSTVVQEGDNFNKIAHRLDLGYVELIEANPGVDPVNPVPGTVIIVPAQYILPNAPREGAVINLAEMRLYYYPKNTHEVWTFPVGIGRQGSQTPPGKMTVYEHMPHPTWHAPESIIIERAKEGVVIPRVVPPGPNNPLGDYALRLSRHSYLIHGTNDSSGVGRRSSAGCLRMYPEDIEKFFYSIKDGDSILVVNDPYKLGRHKNAVYVESHTPLQEVQDKFVQLDKILDGYLLALGGPRTQQAIDMKKALRIASEELGIPQLVGQLTVSDNHTLN